MRDAALSRRPTRRRVALLLGRHPPACPRHGVRPSSGAACPASRRAGATLAASGPVAGAARGLPASCRHVDSSFGSRASPIARGFAGRNGGRVWRAGGVAAVGPELAVVGGHRPCRRSMSNRLNEKGRVAARPWMADVSGRSDPVDEHEQAEPDHVDEVPVPGDRLEREVALRREVAASGAQPDHQQHDRADRDAGRGSRSA